MKLVVINESKCDKSPFCPVVRICPFDAVTQEGGFFSKGFPKIDEDKCTSCEKCVAYCPMGAVEIIKKKSSA